MLKELLSLTLAGFLIATIARVPGLAQTQGSTQSTAAEKIKATVMRMGVGRTRVQVKLRNHMKLKGYIGQIAEEGFSVVDPKSGTVTPVAYDQVLEVKNINPSALARAAIAVGAVVGIMILVAFGARGS
jgi:hypothetical protein